jgi:hypothetical protein
MGVIDVLGRFPPHEKCNSTGKAPYPTGQTQSISTACGSSSISSGVLDYRIRALCSRLIGSGDADEFASIAAQLRAALSDQIERLRGQVQKYTKHPLTKDRRSDNLRTSGIESNAIRWAMLSEPIIPCQYCVLADHFRPWYLAQKVGLRAPSAGMSLRRWIQISAAIVASAGNLNRAT